jgi:hypothetical protein
MKVQLALRSDLPGMCLSPDGHRLLDLALVAAGLADAPRPIVRFARKRVTPRGDGTRDCLNGHFQAAADRSQRPVITMFMPPASEAAFEQTLWHEVAHYRQALAGEPMSEADANAFAASRGGQA